MNVKLLLMTKDLIYGILLILIESQRTHCTLKLSPPITLTTYGATDIM